jgi:Holliday junction resolvase
VKRELTYKTKRPANTHEAELYDLMTEHGWEVTKRGWPDFLCLKGGKLVCIEVKPKRGYKLKSWQRRVMLELVKHGIRAYRWSPDGGFEPVLEYVKFPIDLP